MKKYTVITTFHEEGLKLYGQKMIDTFEKNWDPSIDLVVYAENCNPHYLTSRVKVIDLLANSSDCKAFIQRHKNNPEAHGGLGPHNQNGWNAKKAFRWEAVRFSYKVFSIAHAVENIDTEWLIWLDADSHTHSKVDVSALDRLCPANTSVCYLGRGEKYHSECGWVAYNLTKANTKEFINRFVGMYKQDTIFNEKEWHDSYIWDVVRKQMTTEGMDFYNLNPYPNEKNIAGHPFINSELGKYMDHVKGDRKLNGHSKRIDIIAHQDHPYWQQVRSNNVSKI